MSDRTVIPRLNGGIEENIFKPNSPGWLDVTDTSGKRVKPIIRCNCGRLMNIKEHTVHPDGRVEASFFDMIKDDEDKGGCGWHVFLTLANWTGESFLAGASG